METYLWDIDIHRFYLEQVEQKEEKESFSKEGVSLLMELFEKMSMEITAYFNVEFGTPVFIHIHEILIKERMLNAILFCFSYGYGVNFSNEELKNIIINESTTIYLDTLARQIFPYEKNLLLNQI